MAASPMKQDSTYDFDNLPDKYVPAKGATFMGEVISAVSPLEFYVIPDFMFTCDCAKDVQITEKSTTSHAEYFRFGKYAHDDMQADLKKYFNSQKQIDDVQTQSYREGQLVNCRTEKRGWTRAVVLRAADIRMQQKLVSVYLIDFGEYTEVKFIHITGTVKHFLRYPPLAYKCSLFGVTPVAFKFSSRACQFFRGLVFNRSVRITIMDRLSGSRLERFTDSKPYIVDMTFGTGEEFTRVSETLSKNGMAVLYSPLFKRPAIFRSGKLSLADATFMELTPPSKKVMAELLAQENTRLKLDLEKSGLLRKKQKENDEAADNDDADADNVSLSGFDDEALYRMQQVSSYLAKSNSSCNIIQRGRGKGKPRNCCSPDNICARSVGVGGGERRNAPQMTAGLQQQQPNQHDEPGLLAGCNKLYYEPKLLIGSQQITIPNQVAGAIIGVNGQRIQKVRSESGADLHISDGISGVPERLLTITGTIDQITMAQYLLQQCVKKFEPKFTTDLKNKLTPECFGIC